MHLPDSGSQQFVTTPSLAAGIDRSPLLWPLVAAALLVPALTIAVAAGILGLF